MKSVSEKKSRGPRTSKIVKSKQSYSNGLLPYHCSFYYLARALDAWDGMSICVSSKDAQKKLARTSLNRERSVIFIHLVSDPKIYETVGRCDAQAPSTLNFARFLVCDRPVLMRHQFNFRLEYSVNETHHKQIRSIRKTDLGRKKRCPQYTLPFWVWTLCL